LKIEEPSIEEVSMKSYMVVKSELNDALKQSVASIEFKDNALEKRIVEQTIQMSIQAEERI